MIERGSTTHRVEYLKNQLKSYDPDIRINAIIDLRKEKSRTAVRTLINVANAIPPNRIIGFIATGKQPDLQEQLAAITALSQIDDDRANKFILKLCKYEGGYPVSSSD